MQTVLWILRFAIVLVLVWFAAKNSEPVRLVGLPGQEWMVPLVFVLLVVFIAGMVIGLLAWVPTVVKQRREMSRLRKAALAPLPAGEAAPEPPHGI